MNKAFFKNELLWGEPFQKHLSSLNILVVGLGGVGGYALEMLARCGISKFSIIDFDCVDETNLNRQIIALNSTIGRSKVDLFDQRLRNINSNIVVRCFNEFYSKELNDAIFTEKIDYIVDAIDLMKSKIELLKTALNLNIPVISSFGAGNRIDATKLYITDISDINTKCNFTKNILRNLKHEGISTGINCVVSSEMPKKIQMSSNNQENKRVIASSPFVPSVCGILIAQFIVEKEYKKQISIK